VFIYYYYFVFLLMNTLKIKKKILANKYLSDRILKFWFNVKSSLDFEKKVIFVFAKGPMIVPLK
jgi:hypothetical protein